MFLRNIHFLKKKGFKVAENGMLDTLFVLTLFKLPSNEIKCLNPHLDRRRQCRPPNRVHIILLPIHFSRIHLEREQVKEWIKIGQNNVPLCA
jgi:hypothetical protein